MEEIVFSPEFEKRFQEQKEKGKKALELLDKALEKADQVLKE